jgi:hypothetical protein
VVIFEAPIAPPDEQRFEFDAPGLAKQKAHSDGGPRRIRAASYAVAVRLPMLPSARSVSLVAAPSSIPTVERFMGPSTAAQRQALQRAAPSLVAQAHSGVSVEMTQFVYPGVKR